MTSCVILFPTNKWTFTGNGSNTFAMVGRLMGIVQKPVSDPVMELKNFCYSMLTAVWLVYNPFSQFGPQLELSVADESLE